MSRYHRENPEAESHGNHFAGGRFIGKIPQATETPEQKYRRSLLRAVEDATRIAAECGEACYIIHSPIYANGYHEHDDIEHVVGTKAVCACMFDRVGTDPWGHVIGTVSPAGEWFLNRVEDTLMMIDQ